MEDEDALLERLRAGDEDAFAMLVARHDGALRRVARTFVRTPSAADDVVQETWLGVLRGLDGSRGARRCGPGSSASWSTAHARAQWATLAACRSRRSRTATAGGRAHGVRRRTDAGRARRRGWSYDPETSLLRRELRKELLGASTGWPRPSGP
jgi:DNA-directed RNA polymerase specialized sigma24 family protein